MPGVKQNIGIIHDVSNSQMVEKWALKDTTKLTHFKEQWRIGTELDGLENGIS